MTILAAASAGCFALSLTSVAVAEGMKKPEPKLSLAELASDKTTRYIIIFKEPVATMNVDGSAKRAEFSTLRAQQVLQKANVNALSHL